MEDLTKTSYSITYGNFTTKRMTFISLFTALTVVFTVIFPSIQLPFIPVPITLQTLVVILAGLLLRPTDAFISMSIYLCLGAIGLPVFANGNGGMSVLAGPTGGFLFAFPLAAFFISSATNVIDKKLQGNNYLYIGSILLTSIIFGIFLVYLIGAVGLSAYLGWTYKKAFLYTLAFVPVDLIKIALATSVKMSLKNYTFYK
ncbi:biotin transporter BioY [Haloplasma contractile]|uniref:Biotin transporter n=1 Tax=Haloplasma contractile SSD-17B TaxID=1033810 RepID=U2DSD4_9MOLU|nr:biotin transporter BioY [Haloplasma contractile]ERJ11442.1 Biotin biosynthesis protein BioY [Haloplasma contractile SSD-17B]